MKLNCTVEVYNRLSASANCSRRKAEKSCLAIGKPCSQSKDIHLLLQTSSNKTGTKYKILNNIEKIFSRCVNEGKATIRLIEPALDLVIKAEKIQLKSFLHVLNLALINKLNSKTLGVLDSNPIKQKALTAQKIKTVIKQASDYPILNGFPRITEELHVSGLQRKSFDRQILKLQSLRILNLSDNQLSSLPAELGSLPNLQQLNLSGNLLGKSPKHKWSWLNGVNISKSLCSLNLNSNKLVSLPEQIGKLQYLSQLLLYDNYLTKLPQSIGSLIHLKSLSVGKNNLNFLPGSMINLRLLDLDVSDNSFGLYDANLLNPQIKVPTLLDLAGQIILRSRIYYDASIIPYTLVPYLDKANYCMCGFPCFDSYTNTFMELDLNRISSCFVSSHGGRDIYFECFLCFKCFKRYVN